MSEHPRKLIEVALPLEEINSACKADKDRKTGTIRNLHKWFAPMPLPAWRALLYAALIDDPEDDEKRAYHLDLIKRLVANGADLPASDDVEEARRNLEQQFPGGVPTVMDPFCGGGSTLVEAQRLGLPTFGSDLNPIPVLITRTLTDLLPKVQGEQPLHPDSPIHGQSRATKNTAGESETLPMADAVRKYAGLEGVIRDITWYAERIGEQVKTDLRDYYPSRGGETPVAWLWARTVTCPNPACGIETVLTTSWWLSKKKGELAWIEPRVVNSKVTLDVKTGETSGEAPPSPKIGRGAAFQCLACAHVITEDHVSSTGTTSGLGRRLTAVVSEVDGRRTYRAADEEDIAAAESAVAPDFIPDLSLGPANQYTAPPRFGLKTQLDMYTPRQLVLLSTLAERIAKTADLVIQDGGTPEYAKTISTVLILSLGRMAQTNSALVAWRQRATAHAKAESAFGRADYPMMWDFAEPCFFGGSVGDWLRTVESSCRSLEFTVAGCGSAERIDARQASLDHPGLIATDPPYFDAIPYADLSDYFYVWHRLAGRELHADLYSTVAAPKAGELTAFPWHHDGTKDGAREYFINGFVEVFEQLKRSLLPSLPMLVVYASKEQQAGSGEETRWAAILTAIIRANMEIVATWPIHGTGTTRMRSQASNAVASYVAMVCRPRGREVSVCSLSEFNRALRLELKPAVEELQAAGILPVDLAQAAMGPGMQVYSRYRAVLDQAGRSVPVDQALRLINQALSEVLDEQEGELDPVSRFAVTVWDKRHWTDVPFGEADQVARPQGISVDEVVRSHVAEFPRAGYIRLMGNEPLDRDWRPSSDARPTAWEAVHHLADRLIDGGGVVEAGRLMGELGVWRDQAQALVYRLHAIADRKGRTKDQERYNALIASWSDLLAEAGRIHESRDGLF